MATKTKTQTPALPFDAPSNVAKGKRLYVPNAKCVHNVDPKACSTCFKLANPSPAAKPETKGPGLFGNTVKVDLQKLASLSPEDKLAYIESLSKPEPKKPRQEVYRSPNFSETGIYIWKLGGGTPGASRTGGTLVMYAQGMINAYESWPVFKAFFEANEQEIRAKAAEYVASKAK